MEAKAHIRMGFFQDDQGEDTLLIACDPVGVQSLSAVLGELNGNGVNEVELGQLLGPDAALRVNVRARVEAQNPGLMREPGGLFIWRQNREHWTAISTLLNGVASGEITGTQHYLHQSASSDRALRILLSTQPFAEAWWKANVTAAPRPRYSVVIPVYNSAEMLEELVASLLQTMDGMGDPFEIVLVDDGSRDESWANLLRLKADHPEQLTIVKLARNSGQNAATICGIVESRGRRIITIDDDLQTPPEEIPKLVRRFEETDADVVYGQYPEKQHSFLRNLGSKSIKFLYKAFVPDGVIGSSFRLISERLAKEIKCHAKQNLFVDQVISWYTPDISFQEVEHRERPSGNSGYSIFSLFKLAWQLVVHHTEIPLRVMIILGFVTSVLSFFLGGFFILQRLTVGSPIGFTATIVSIFFATGLIMFCLGIVGEYISRLYTSQSGRPQFSVKIKK